MYKRQPYNVTVLTLGTHLPGYIYESCQPYSGSDEQFINAIHCTDQLVGQFVKELEQAGLLENTVLMLVADHGVFRTAKMEELFGDVVDDKKLIGITNYPQLTETTLSSYDLAPTVLDMLKVEHNASFLFGQSIFDENKNQQKHVTRLNDWQDNKMIKNPKGDCDEKTKLGWPLIKCQKNQLIGLTNQILEFYSLRDAPEPLGCHLDVQFTYEPNKNDQWKWVLRLNKNDHFGHFYHKGYLLKTNNHKAGYFAFILNEELAIEQHLYFKDDSEAKPKLNFVAGMDKHLLIVKSTLQQDKTSPIGEKMAIQVDFYESKAKLWSEKTTSSKIKGLDLCQNT